MNRQNTVYLSCVLWAVLQGHLFGQVGGQVAGQVISGALENSSDAAFSAVGNHDYFANHDPSMDYLESAIEQVPDRGKQYPNYIKVIRTNDRSPAYTASRRSSTASTNNVANSAHANSVHGNSVQFNKAVRYSPSQFGAPVHSGYTAVAPSAGFQPVHSSTCIQGPGRAQGNYYPGMPHRHSATLIAPPVQSQITKRSFQYGDFGATTYHQRSVQSGSMTTTWSW